MGLKDRIASERARVSAQASRLAGAAAAAATDKIAGSDSAGARLIAIIRMDDDQALTIESLLVLLVDAVNSDDPTRELTDDDVKKAAKRRGRLAGTAGALGGPVGLNIASLYCEAEILCDVAERHRLRLADEELAAHLMVLWNLMPDVSSATAAIDGTGQSVVARIASHAHARVVTKPREEMTKRDVVRTIWRLRNVMEDVEMPGSDRYRDAFLPGKRVKAVTQAAEHQLGVVRG